MFFQPWKYVTRASVNVGGNGARNIFLFLFFIDVSFTETNDPTILTSHDTNGTRTLEIMTRRGSEIGTSNGKLTFLIVETEFDEVGADG